MAHYQNQYGPTPGDQYGNVTQQTDEYGNPIPQAGTGGAGTDTFGATPAGVYGSTGEAYGATTGAPGHVQHGHEQHHGRGGVSGMFHRSGSSSSSSSEDDGQGGRRRKKKGLKEKIKEKMPGHHAEQTPSTATTTGYDVGHGQQLHEKKGMMEKIKEKLPGHH